MMQFDFKVTAWERVTVSDEFEQEVFEAIKSGKISSANDVYMFLNDKDCSIDCELIEQTTTQMTIEENGGQSTIEVLDETETVWTNTPIDDEEIVTKGEWREMDLWAEYNAIIRYTGKNGSDKAHADRYLAIGEKYTVSNINVDKWESRVYLKEFPAVIAGFNTVHFEQFYPNED